LTSPAPKTVCAVVNLEVLVDRLRRAASLAHLFRYLWLLYVAREFRTLGQLSLQWVHFLLIPPNVIDALGRIEIIDLTFCPNRAYLIFFILFREHRGIYRFNLAVLGLRRFRLERGFYITLLRRACFVEGESVGLC
jgi:hypothetical protein